MKHNHEDAALVTLAFFEDGQQSPGAYHPVQNPTGFAKSFVFNKPKRLGLWHDSCNETQAG